MPFDPKNVEKKIEKIEARRAERELWEASVEAGFEDLDDYRAWLGLEKLRKLNREERKRQEDKRPTAVPAGVSISHSTFHQGLSLDVPGSVRISDSKFLSASHRDAHTGDSFRKGTYRPPTLHY